jgi:hypothetical protein
LVYVKHNRKYKTKSLTNGSSDNLLLPETGLLSAIELVFSAVNASAVQDNNKARIIDHLTTIEINDGGTKKMFSLTGYEAKALDFYALGQVPHETAILYGNKTQRTQVTIPFGDYVGDPKHAFDLSAFDQVNLSITNDATTAMWAAAALNVDVQLVTLEELAAKPDSYYKSYQWKAEKPANAGQYVYHLLPTTDKIRRLMLMLDPDIGTTGNATNDPVSDSNNIKMTFNEGKEPIWDHRPKDLMRANAAMYGQVVTHGRYYMSTTQYLDNQVAYKTNSHFGEVTDAAPSAGDICELTESNSRYEVAGANSTGTTYFDLEAVGIGYLHSMCLFDAYGGDPALYLDPSKTAKGPVQIEVYNVQADHTVRTFLTIPQKQGQA